MKTNYLAHHGVLGMRWGIRRYQDKNGDLTALGKQRLAREEFNNASKSKDKRIASDKVNNPEKWVTQDYQANQQAANAGKQLTNELANLEKATRPKKDNPRLNLDNMTDKELRDKINRELLERQYNQVFNSREISRGREAVQDFLSIAGSTLGVVSSSLAIALAIRQLKGLGQ